MAEERDFLARERDRLYVGERVIVLSDVTLVEGDVAVIGPMRLGLPADYIVQTPAGHRVRATRDRIFRATDELHELLVLVRRQRQLLGIAERHVKEALIQAMEARVTP